MTSWVSWRRTGIAFCIALCVSVAVPSAAQNVGGTLLGTVVDNSGAVLPGAGVTATNTATAVARTTISDGQGRYSIADFPPGRYDVSASLSGFQTVLRRGIRLVVGNSSVVDFALGISGVAETVTVSGAAPVVDTVSTAIGTVVEQKQMAELPLIDRSYSRLIKLAPGANEVPPATSGGQFQQFFGRQPQYTVSGARPEGQVFLLDNTNVQNYWNRGSGSGQLGTTLGVEAIAKYQVLTNTYSAQFGGNGVAINAITKSGTNQFHGRCSIFSRQRARRVELLRQLLGRPVSDAQEKSIWREPRRPARSEQGVLLLQLRGPSPDARHHPGDHRVGRQRSQRRRQRRARRGERGDRPGVPPVPGGRCGIRWRRPRRASARPTS